MNKTETTAARTQKPKTNGNGNGSVFRVDGNKWKGSFVIGYHPETGKPIRRTKTAKTRQAILDWLDEMKLQYGKGPKGIVNVSKVLFDDIADEYFAKCIEDTEAGNCSSHTVSQRIGIYDKHIATEFGHRKLTAITEKMLTNFLSSLRDGNGLTRTAQIAKTVLTQIYEHAVDKGYCQRNLVYAVHIPQQTKAQKKKQASKKHTRAIPAEFQHQILNVAEAYPLINTVLNIMFFAGLRIGEVLALRWECINFREKKIHVDSALVTKATFGEDNRVLGSRTEIGSPKTEASWRKLGMGNHLEACILAWRDYLISTGVPAETLSGSTLVFRTRNGTHYTEDGFRSIFKRFLVKEELTRHGLCHHSFRHAFAVNMLQSGSSIHEIQKALGHQDLKTTFLYLGAELDTNLARLANNLEEFWFEREEKINEHSALCSSF